MFRPEFMSAYFKLLNPDVSSPHNNNMEEKDNITEARLYLIRKKIPEVAEKLFASNFQGSSENLVLAVHAEGINLRWVCIIFSLISFFNIL